MSDNSRPLGRSGGRAKRVVQVHPPGQPVEQASAIVRAGSSRGGPLPPQGSIGRAEKPPTQQPASVPAEASSQQGAGGSGDAAALGRGALRGRRVISADILATGPKALVSKQGTDGHPVALQANFFKILAATNWCLYKYRVDFAPDEDRIAVRKGMLRLHKEKIGAYIFDGSVLYTSNQLPQPLELYSKRQSDDESIRITVKLVGDMTQGDEDYIQFFNIIMRKCLEFLHLQLVGRNFFDARAKVAIREYKLELWPGYETSIRQHEYDMLMSVEIQHKVMRQQTVMDILNECYNRHGRDRYQAAFSAEVIGITVLTDYNNETYRIDDVNYKESPECTFQRKGETISYLDYYKAKYGITIRNVAQPLLMSKSKARERRAGASEFVYLIPELCRVTGITDAMRSDFRMMRELDVHTKLNPDARIQRLLAFNKRLQEEPKIVQEFQDWNLALDNKLLTVNGRILDTQKIVFGRQVQVSAGPQADWSRALRDQHMLYSVHLKDWFVVVPNRLVRDAQSFLGTMRSSITRMAYQISDPKNLVLDDDRAQSYTTAIENIMSKSAPQLIMCIMPNNRADRYSAIKKKCCIDRPVPTQCILAKNLNSKGTQTIATKVAVQINCKLGGAAWSTIIPAKGIMVVGFDVCHDTNDKNRDYGALVASLDSAFTRYFSAVTAHKNGEELSNDLSVNMCKAIHKYREINQALPSRIVMYRDGVGDGQIPFVQEHEVENVKSKLAAIYGDPASVKMTYIIVTKRINTRLFYDRGNAPPGTVVDDVITNPLKYDFYIVSQYIKQGTVSPTGFTVISDNADLNANKLQVLSYKLTHMYYNWSGTVRVPAPCQFAHKLAFLVSQSIHASPSNHLETLLYFL